MGNQKSTDKNNRLDEDEYISWLSAFNIIYTHYCNTVGSDYIRDAGFDRSGIIAVFNRIKQRELYYRTFHNMPHGLNEVKATALLCFWLLKYRVLYVEFRDRNNTEKVEGLAKENYDNALMYFTERFCVFLMNAISWRFKGYAITLSDMYYAEMCYNFRNADISKEAMIMLFEAYIPVY